MSDSEEEIIVAVDFSSPVPEASEAMQYKVIGLDTNTPIFQYGKQVFKGEWKDVIGTKLYFGESNAPRNLDPVFQPDTPKQFEVEYVVKKVLKLETLVLTPKETDNSETNVKEEKMDDSDNSVDGVDVEEIPIKGVK